MGVLVPIPDYDDAASIQEIIGRIGDSAVAVEQLNGLSRSLESAATYSSDDVRASLRTAIVSAQRAVVTNFSQRFNQTIRYAPESGVILDFRRSGDSVSVMRYVAESMNQAWKLDVPGYAVQRFVEEVRERIGGLELGIPRIDTGAFDADSTSHRKINWSLCSGLFSMGRYTHSRALLFSFLADRDRR